MDTANRFELHYYFSDQRRHDIDALVRNKCEAELLAIILESAALLEIDATAIAEAYRQGGFRDVWKLIGTNANSITVLLLIVQLVLTAIPLVDFEGKDLEKELNKLSIEEKKLQIEKLKNELKEQKAGTDRIDQAAGAVGSSLKIIKRKSNFYAYLDRYVQVNKIGFSALNDDLVPITSEKIIPRSEFSRFILTTNRLRSEEDNDAVIEIISPVLKEGRYKWKGLYRGNVISFEMLDPAFRDAVLFEKIPFQHGTKIVCVLIMNRELDESGEIKVTGFAVTTVIEKIDGDQSVETAQGKQYRHARKLREGQGDLFDEVRPKE